MQPSVMSYTVYIPGDGYYNLDIPQCPNASNTLITCEIGPPLPQAPTPPTEPAPWPVTNVVVVPPPVSEPQGDVASPEPGTFLMAALVLFVIARLRWRCRDSRTI